MNDSVRSLVLAFAVTSMLLCSACDSGERGAEKGQQKTADHAAATGAGAATPPGAAQPVPALAELTERLEATKAEAQDPQELDLEKEKAALGQQAKDFLGALLASDARLYEKYMLTDDEVVACFGEEQARLLAVETRVQSHDAIRELVRELVGDAQVKVGDLQIPSMGVEDSNVRPRNLIAGNLTLPFEAGYARAELRFTAAVRTPQGWRFLHFLCARKRLK